MTTEVKSFHKISSQSNFSSTSSSFSSSPSSSMGYPFNPSTATSLACVVVLWRSLKHVEGFRQTCQVCIFLDRISLIPSIQASGRQTSVTVVMLVVAAITPLPMTSMMLRKASIQLMDGASLGSNISNQPLSPLIIQKIRRPASCSSTSILQR